MSVSHETFESDPPGVKYLRVLHGGSIVQAVRPTVDPRNHPEALNFFERRVRLADDDDRLVENATLAIYSTAPPSTRPQQVGSGVLLRIVDQYFVLSATHVFEHVGEWALMLGRPAHELMEPIGGERFVAGRPEDDPASDRLDASVFHIHSGLTDSLRRVAITLDQVDRMGMDDQMSVHGAIGYFAKKSRTIGHEAHVARERLVSGEYRDDDYAKLGVNRATHLALAYEDQVWVSDRWQTSPTPTGFSGGAIVRYDGVSFNPHIHPRDAVRPVLAGITIERWKANGNVSPGALKGTRVGVHLSLIRGFLPELAGLEPWLGKAD